MINNLNLRQRISKNWITIILALIILILGLKYYELKNEFNRINKNSVNKNSLIEELEDEKEDLEYEKRN
ncbi:MAG: hypothetical protein IPL09_07670 [Bacteroidetes bacterium]|nr:hypothetical protein [Bacteroidota bacterium]